MPSQTGDSADDVMRQVVAVLSDAHIALKRVESDVNRTIGVLRAFLALQDRQSSAYDPCEHCGESYEDHCGCDEGHLRCHGHGFEMPVVVPFPMDQWNKP